MTAPTAPSQSPPTVNTLILDAGPILSPHSVPSFYTSRATRILTTPSVISEIRDATARSRFETQWSPFVAVRTPKAASARFAAEFAKKTGDYAVLSAADLGLLALAYELELEVAGGDWRLRSAPGRELNGPVPEWWEKGLDGPPVEEGKTERGRADVPEETGENGGSGGKAEETEEGKEEDAEQTTEQLASTLESTTIHDPVEVSSSEADSDSDEDDDDDEGWITPSNLHKHLHAPAPVSTATSSFPNRKLTVALATTDYALQNTALQLNIPLLSSSSLQPITSIRSTVLRCHACFYIHRPSPSTPSPADFCPRCGGAKTLLRTTCSTDAAGVFRVHLKKNFQYNTRGNVYSLPKPRHGTASGKGLPDRPVLSADQTEYERAVRREKWRKEKDLLDPDVLPGILTGSRNAHSAVRVGTGKRNPNEPRRGGGRRKR